MIVGEKVIGNGEVIIWTRGGKIRMSYQNFVKAMDLAPKCKFYTTVGGKSKEEIEKSEQMLDVKFSNQCREFYEKYGYLSFYGNEIFGIEPDDDSGILEGNSVAYALNDRAEYNLPSKWIPIYNFEDGSMAYLDYSSINSEGEPRDLGDFVLQLVQEQLEA